MPNSAVPAWARRRWLQAAGAALGGMALPRVALTDAPQLAGARLTADFDPVEAMWLGYDPGHEDFTLDLAEALWPHAEVRMLVRDAEAEAQAIGALRSRHLDASQVEFVHDAAAPFFVRDAAVFGLDGRDKPFILDFQWTQYGWASWCRRRHAGNTARAQECSRPGDTPVGQVDQRLAMALDMPSRASPLAIEGGGVEVNGRGLMIANAALWRERNRGMSLATIEKHLLALPGMRKVIWVPNGLAHDTLHRATITGHYVGWGTGGHTDEFVRFADETTVLLAWVDEEEAHAHPVARLNRQRMRANLDILKASTDPRGRPLRVLKVPLPRMVERPVVLKADADVRDAQEWTAASFPAREGRREGDTVIHVAAASYLNHVVANDLVLLPTYVAHGTPPERQERVRKLYESAFQGRKIAFVDAMNANWYGGGAHCATLSQPAAGEG